MGEKVTVTVLQDDIDSGVKGSSIGCAIARSLRRDQHCERVWVHGVAALGDGRVLRLPQEARDFIDRFDYFSDAQPVKFEAEVCDDVTVRWAREGSLGFVPVYSPKG